MVNSIGSLLTQRELFEPPEIAVIKKFVLDRYQLQPTVTVQDKEIIIGVTSSALAGALRPQLPELQKACNTDKRLVLRIQ